MPDKRILILTNRVPHPLNDGGNIAMNAMIQGYKDAGWHVSLLSMNTSRHPVPQDEQQRIYKDIDAFESVAVDNRVKPVPTVANFLFSTKPNHVERFANKEFAARIGKCMKAFKPDVVQIESVFLTNYLAEVKAAGNPVTVLRLHNLEYQIWERLAAEHKGFLKHFYFRNLSERIKKYEAWAWKQYDVLLPITEVDAAIVRSNPTQANIITIPVGIEADKIKATAATAEWSGYHIGAMDWLPNKEAMNWFLKDVWPGIHDAVPDFKFYFAGREMPASYKKQQADGVICAGEVPDAEAFIVDKRILIVPLRSGGGIRVKILEAMAAGKIVISTDIGMQGIEAVSGNHYLKANSANAFAEAVAWCIGHKEEAEGIGKAAAALIREKYNLTSIMQQLDAVLHK